MTKNKNETTTAPSPNNPEENGGSTPTGLAATHEILGLHTNSAPFVCGVEDRMNKQQDHLLHLAPDWDAPRRIKESQPTKPMEIAHREAVAALSRLARFDADRASKLRLELYRGDLDQPMPRPHYVTGKGSRRRVYISDQ